MKKSLLITVFISCTSFSLPSHAYKQSIFLEKSHFLSKVFVDNFKSTKNNSILIANLNLGGSGGYGGSGSSGLGSGGSGSSGLGLSLIHI